jgi:hypothetical protein
MSKNESAQTRELCRELEACSAITYSAIGNMMSVPGWPDRYVHHAAWHGWLEFKIEGKYLTPLQRQRILELNHRVPGSAFVVRHVGIIGLQVENADGIKLCQVHSGSDRAFRLLIALASCRDVILQKQAE